MESIGKHLNQKMGLQQWRQQYERLVQKALQDEEVQEFIQKHQAELSPDFQKRDASKLYEFVSVKEKIARGEETFTPGYHPILQVSDHHIEIAYQPTEEYLAEKKRQKRQNLISLVNLPKSLRKATIDTYNQETTDRVNLRLDIMDFVNSYLESQDNQTTPPQGFYIEGSFGVGKTYTLGVIANELAQYDIPVTMVHLPSFIVAVKKAIGDNKNVHLVDEIKKTPILMIDDIGADQLSSWSRDDVLGVILQYRMQEELPTFFSSNIAMEDLTEQYLTLNNRGEAEPLKAQRIMERINFLARPYQMTGENYRNRK
nr:primosomal protein DnaI [Ligilactobacillus ceti]